jgi:16S rRNA (cytosine967-C5)-methyltransferase
VRRAVAAVPAGVVDVVTADATQPPWAGESFDRVLVDAPCSGLGALRRRPESRWRRTAADLEGLVPLQRELLARAVEATRPGGVTAYVTCSPVLAETAGVVEHLLGSRDDVELLDADEVAGEVLGPVPDHAGPVKGTVQLWPHRHGTDAMFLALLRRR